VERGDRARGFRLLARRRLSKIALPLIEPASVIDTVDGPGRARPYRIEASSRRAGVPTHHTTVRQMRARRPAARLPDARRHPFPFRSREGSFSRWLTARRCSGVQRSAQPATGKRAVEISEPLLRDLVPLPGRSSDPRASRHRPPLRSRAASPGGLDHATRPRRAAGSTAFASRTRPARRRLTWAARGRVPCRSPTRGRMDRRSGRAASRVRR
jgi:hypothetical protein